ncbi:Ribose operon repressor [Polystyrenella longa]|uniref:Ribose operon repressor n=1 Tax=Polystyrenella longa TaxID=2528007 RepID=A0A518CSU1_9PLAN|nr:LacI family DNA-binding transcriptional regulator [Polystyrenella longa]QDU82299.1 Ribose operon repressor [Polystyrenella longa]
MAATILDVARLAKVSAGTVSRVLHKHPGVSDENRERVLDAIKTLDYSPRQRKASMCDLNPLEDKNVLLLLLGMDPSLANLPVVTAAIDGIEQSLINLNANLLIANLPTLDQFPEEFDRKRIDGVILKGALQGDLAGQVNPELVKRVQELPAVWVLGRPEGMTGDVVQVDDVRVGKLAAEHLISCGHRHLAFLSPKPSQVSIQRRQASFTFYAQQAGATVNSYLGNEQDWTFPSPAVDHCEWVDDLVERLLNTHPRPTAMFTPDDSTGTTVARTLSARNLKAGEDISLMSCNNEQKILEKIQPSLTTIDVHAADIGCRAVDQLAWRIAHPAQPNVDISYEPTLVTGSSVATLDHCAIA